jgi:hypothetical protein
MKSACMEMDVRRISAFLQVGSSTCGNLVSAPSDNPSVDQHDRDGPRSHERGHLCGFRECTAIKRHAHRQKEHAQKAQAANRSWSWEIAHWPPD